ncbi:MAG: aminoacyl-tRNA hydrolase [Planctomycetes bacterium]|nr:aminoacyl-tRNA hydrolase [Planctomycetota bacterium]
MLVVNSRLRIPREEFELSFARSSGPGGQNVNKVNTKATLRWPVRNSPSLPGPVKARFLDRYASRLTTEGELVISSQRFRSQAKNVDDCLEKLSAMLAAVATPPVKRKPTRPSAASKERRLREKRSRSQKKQQRTVGERE